MSTGYPGSTGRYFPGKTATNNRTAQQTASQENAAAAKKKADAAAAAKAAQAKKALKLRKGTGALRQYDEQTNMGAISDAGFPVATYVYNAPMVKSAYLSAEGPQQKTSLTPVSSAGNYANARDAWKPGNETAKGTIQMNAAYATNLSKASSQTSKQYDDNLYGFKFMYNPTEVGMAWGLVEGVNWEVIQSGLDKLTPIGAGLTQTTISFSVLLNRINDMPYLDSNGLIPGVANPYETFRTKTGNINDELKQIYAKGTMYDMEYFFKTVNGFNSVYTSSLNGETADQGWLNGIPVELHLGAGLRYLVRISNIDINHQMFNERMVPIKSVLNLTCTRFYDNNVIDPTKYTFSGGTTP
jgi:hypothetical protein